MAGKHPEYAQELLGHARINIILDMYSPELPGMNNGLADALEDALR